ncbi:MAG: TolC family protein [Deltaproteobacteria bacterium]|nr:TolC family protein [Deltaproteobacteria bacterium]
MPEGLPTRTPGRAMSLTQALQMADERNLSLAATRTEIARADAELYMARAALFPNASGTLTLTHRDHEDAASIGGSRIVTRNQDDLAGALDVSMPLVNAQIWMGIRAGKAGEEIAELSVETARQALLASVATAYYQALTAKGLIDVQQGQIRSAARYLEVAKTRFRSGVGARLDVLRAKADVVRAVDQLRAAVVAFDNARDALGILTGAGGMPTPVESSEIGAPTAGEDELIERAATNREDLQLKRAMVELADRQVDVAWMQFLPSLNASWQLTHQFTSPSSFGDQDRTRWAAYLVLSVPIYNQTRYADLDIKRAARNKAQIEAEDAAQRTALEVRQARRDYLSAIDSVQTATQQAELARETLTLTEIEYIAGTGSSLAVTDARRASREAELNLAIRRFEAQTALLALLRAAGDDMSQLGG